MKTLGISERSFDYKQTLNALKAIAYEIANEPKFQELIKDPVQEKSLTPDELVQKCFQIGDLDIKISKESLQKYPVIQIYEFYSAENRTNFLVEDITIAIQTNVYDAKSGVLIKDIMDHALKNKMIKFNTTIISLLPIYKRYGKMVPTNTYGTHAYMSLYEFKFMNY